jgi:hypothetical protein
MEAKLKHLEMIQGVVNRLAGNSFSLKGWSVVLVAALFAIAAPGARVELVVIAYIPAVVFWGLDGYFLAQERRYRALYDAVRVLAPEAIDFSMDTSPFASEARCRWDHAVRSNTLLAFHGVLLGSIVMVMILMLITGD